MTQDASDVKIEVPEISTEKVIKINDVHFHPDNVCIVTGAGSGIGRATTIALAENDLTVAATDVSEDGLAETKSVAERNDVGENVYTITADLTEDNEVEAIVEAASQLGSIKFLANIAGVQHIASIENFPMDVYDTMHGILLRAPLLLTKLCFPHFKESENGEGCVGTVSSVHGHYVTANKVSYNIHKFGVRGLTQSITAEGNGDIWSFSLSPSPVKTPMVVNQIPDIAEERGVSIDEAINEVLLGPYQVKELIDPIDIGNFFVLGFSQKGKHFAGGDLLLDAGATTTY